MHFFFPIATDNTHEKQVEGHMKAVLTLGTPEASSAPPRFDYNQPFVSFLCNFKLLGSVDYLKHCILLACSFIVYFSLCKIGLLASVAGLYIIPLC